MRDVVGITVLMVAVPLVALGCASRDWAPGLFSKQEADLDERLVDVESRVGTQAERIEGLGGRLVSLETSLAETTEVAKGARERAESAVAKADAVDKRLARYVSSVVTTRPARDPVKVRTLLGTVHVRFGFNRSDLDDEAETALVSVVRELRENPSLTVDLEGATDSVGARDYNLQLSLRRLEAVRRYLLARGIELPRIMHSAAVGALRDDGIPEEHKRRVTVKLMKAPE